MKPRMWIPNPEADAASHYLMAILSGTVAGRRWEDVWPLLSVLYDLEECSDPPRALRPMFDEMMKAGSDASACLQRLERWAEREAGSALDGPFVQIVMPSVPRLHTWLKARVRQHPEFNDIITDDTTMYLAMARGADAGLAVARQRQRDPKALPLTLLIGGPTGAGKEVLARALHQIAQRGTKATTTSGFGPINCGSFPGELIEAELFGHTKGAFTNAAEARDGIIETHATGTVFLDEIGDAPPAVQVRLLRFLNDGEVRRVGEDKPRRVAPWVICATNRDLSQRVAKSEFRDDLLFRLRGTVLNLPPLAARRADVMPILKACLARSAGRPIEPRFGSAATIALETYPWPGNVRELAQLAAELLSTLADGADQLVVRLGTLPQLIHQHYHATRSTSDQMVDLYADRVPDESDFDSGRREALVRMYGAFVRTGQPPDLRFALFVERLAKSGLLAALTSSDVAMKAHAVAKYRRENTARQLEDALMAKLAVVDGRPIAPTMQVMPKAPSEAGLPSWLRHLLKLAEDASLDNTQLVVMVRNLLAKLETLSPNARSTVESLMTAFIEDAKKQAAAERDAESSSASEDGPHHSWEEVRQARDVFERYLKTYKTATAMAEAFSKSERTVRAAAERLGVELKRGGVRESATGNAARATGRRKRA